MIRLYNILLEFYIYDTVSQLASHCARAIRQETLIKFIIIIIKFAIVT